MKKLITALFLFMAISASATTWYISESGSDATGNGTIGNPWRSLFKATSTVTTAGDIIHVNAGTYPETVQSILAAGVSIEGDGIASVITSTVGGASDASFVPLIDATSSSATDGNQHISNLKFDGQMASSYLIWVGYRNNFSIYNCTIVNFYNMGCIFSATNDFWTTAEPASRRTGNSFHDNILTNCANYAGWGRGCICIGGQIGFDMYNNTITQDSRISGKNGWPIKYWNDGYTQGLKIHDNTITKNLLFGTGEDWSFCMEIFNGQGTEIYNNTIQGSLDFNFQGNRGAYPYVLYIHDNNISIPAYSDRVQEGIIMEYSVDGMIVENNTFDHLFNVCAFYPRPGAMIRNVVFRKNLVKNLGSGAASAYFIGGFDAVTDTVRNMQIVNNTILNDTTPNHNGDFCFRLNGFSAGTVWDSLIIKNNIIKGFSGTAAYIEDISKFTRCEFKYNDINGWDEFGGQDNVNWVPTWHSVYASYPGTIAISNNLAGVQPGFVGGGNFTLSSGSPLIDAGTNVGLAYSGAAPDLGYAEFGISGNVSPSANAGSDQSTVSTSVTLSGSGTDSDGTISSYAWVKLSGTGGAIVSPSSASTSVTGLSVGTYIFQLTVTDNLGGTGTDTITITITSSGGTTIRNYFVIPRKCNL